MVVFKSCSDGGIMSAKQVELIKSRIIRDTLGVRSAAGYLRNRGWSVEAAAHILARRGV